MTGYLDRDEALRAAGLTHSRGDGRGAGRRRCRRGTPRRMCGRGAACPRGSQGGRAGQDELPVGSALHPRAHARQAPASSSKLGALPRILALNPSKVRWTTLVAEGITCTERLRPAPDGTDFGVCVPRDLQDVCLVEAVREQGGDVRERSTFSSLHWRAGRVAGVRYTDEHGDRARHLGDARRRGRRPPLQRRRAGRRLDPVPGLAQRPRPGLPLPRRPPGGDPRRGDLHPVARGRLVRVRLPDGSGGQAADPAHGPPRRGQRGAQGPRGLLAAQARRAPRRSPSGSPAWTRAPTRSCARPARRRPSSAPRPGRAGRWPATPGTSRTR